MTPGPDGPAEVAAIARGNDGASVALGTERRFEATAGKGRTAVRGVVFRFGASLGESPSWNAARDRIEGVDIVGGRLFALDRATGTVAWIPVARRTTALVRTRRGTRMLAASDRLDEVDDRGIVVSTLAFDGWPAGGCIFNDAKADRHGRLWIGTRHPDGRVGEGRIYRLDPGMAPVLVDDGYAVPNGLAWSPDGDRLYVADSRRRLVLAYELDDEGCAVGRPSVLVDFGAQPGRPDGLTVDVEGHLWCAIWDGGAVRRFDPSGRLASEIRLPALRPTSCAFAGPALDRLVITSAVHPDHDPSDWGGALFELEPGMTGLPEPVMA